MAATALLPGPASTQLAIYCAWRVRRGVGAVVGGVSFIAPGLVATIALSAIVLAHNPSPYVMGAAAGAGAAVAAVAVRAGTDLVPASWRRAGAQRAARLRWAGYVALGALATITVGAWVAAAIVLAGLVELATRRGSVSLRGVPPLLGVGGLGGLVWTALKVGALSYGGGFVIIPLMQSDAVDRYHWMTGSQFLSAVVLGQLTPGPWCIRWPWSASRRPECWAHCWPPRSPSPRRSCSSWPVPVGCSVCATTSPPSPSSPGPEPARSGRSVGQPYG